MNTVLLQEESQLNGRFGLEIDMNLDRTVVTVEAPERIYPEKDMEVKELDEETFNGLAKEDDDPTLTVDELVARFALIQNISKEEARE